MAMFISIGLFVDRGGGGGGGRRRRRIL